MMKLLRKALIAYLASGTIAFANTPGDSTITITFDDLPATHKRIAQVPDGYAGLNWYEFSCLDTPDFRTPNEFHQPAASLSKAAVDTSGKPAGFFSTDQAFDLESALLMAECKDDLQVRVEGFLGDTLRYDRTFSLNAAKTTLIDFDYLDITMVKLIPLDRGLHSRNPDGGEPGWFRHGGTQFAIDDVKIRFIPEPGPAELLLVGFALAGFDFLRSGIRHFHKHKRRSRF